MLKKIIFIQFIVLSFNSLAQYPNNTFTTSKNNGCVGESITFTSTSTPGSSGAAITSVKWDFGDGNVQEVFAPNNTASHSYNSTGSYTVFFYATNSSGTTPVATSTVITITSNPSINFTANPASCNLPVTANITNSSVSGNYTYDWDFGNGQTSSSYTPTGISYATAGTFPIGLIVTNNSTNCSSTLSKNIIVNDFEANFTLSKDSICQNSSVTLTNDSPGSTSWLWNSGNGTTNTSQNNTFYYNNSGTYTISLTATNSSNNCTDQITKQIVVFSKPILSVSANPNSGCAPLDVTFTNNSTNGNTYAWNFGDGSAVYNGVTPPLHTYTIDGNYTVSLTGTNNFGCTQSGNITVIQVRPPVANFTSDIIDGCSPIDVQFTNTSVASNSASDPIVGWSWDFGNGNISTSQNPAIETFVTGKYDVSLTITTSKGCTATINNLEYIKVGEIDSVGFTNTPDTSCAKSDITFTNTTNITVPHDPSEIIYEWDFGDTGTDSAKDPVYNYPIDTGSFDVTLTVNFRGCIDTYKKDSAVFIWSPISNFTVSNICNPAIFPAEGIVIDAAKIGRNGDDVEMIYRWGDALNSMTNFTSASFDPNSDQWSSSFNYTNYGTYTIKQVVYNNTTGCSDSTTNDIVISRVDPDFSLVQDSVCFGGMITMTDASSSVTGPIGSVSYDVTENNIMGNVLSQTNYTYGTSGTFNITITATDLSGCSSTTSLPVNILSLPLANISADDLTPCAPQAISFLNASNFTGAVHATSITNSSWILPDNSTVNNVTESVPYNINSQGNYLTSLQVTDDFGCVSLRDTLIINVSKPIASFNQPPTICNNAGYVFTNNSTGVSNEWTIDNVSTSITEDLNHTFNETSTQATNTHKVTVITSDINGCKDSLSRTVTISIPNADFTYTLTGDNQSAANEFSCPPVQVSVVNLSSTPSVSSWIFGNGNISAVASPSATYYAPGTYTLSLKITNQFNCKDSLVLVDYLFIGGPKATPIITPPIDICKNIFTFSVTDTAEIFSYYWDLGDNTSSTLDSLTNRYPLAGTYYPTLTVYDKENCSVKYNGDTITVLNELTAIHTVSPNPGETNELITFSDQSLFKGTITNWLWEFGDFDNSILSSDNGNDQYYKYLYPYSYISILTVTDNFGCTSSDTVIVKINGKFQTPNVFTPNFDGINDVFQFDKDIFDKYDVLILNRWGNVVYDKKSVTGTYIWDGIHNDGKECTDGVYFFKVVGTIKDLSPFEATGYVTKVKG